MTYIDYSKIETAVAKGIIRAILWIIIFQMFLVAILFLVALLAGYIDMPGNP